jgi:hypothetical protein
VEEEAAQGMSFGGIFDDEEAAAQYPYATAAGSGVFASSPALSLALVRAAGCDWVLLGAVE